MSPLDDLDFAICGICGDEHDNGFGYCPSGKDKILWACTECLPIAPHVYGVSQVDISHHSKLARDKAGEEGGAFLEKIGKFSLADLTEEEWRKFLDTMFLARAKELKRLYGTHAAPF